MEQRVVQLGRRHAGAPVVEIDFPVEFQQVVVAVGQHRGLVGDHVRLLAAVAQDVVPDRFQAVLRQRKRHAYRSALDAVAGGNQPGRRGVLPSRVVDALWHCRAAPGRIHAQRVVQMLTEQLLQAFGQLRAVCAQGAAVDDPQWRVLGVWVGMVHAWLVATRRRVQAARPGGDAAIGSAGAFGAQRGEGMVQARGLSRVDLGLGVQRAAGQQQYYQGFQHSFAPRDR